MEINEKILEATAEFSFDVFCGAIGDAAESDELDEYHTAVGLLCDAVGYIKEVGMSEDELIEHVRETYQSYVVDDEDDTALALAKEIKDKIKDIN